MLYNCNLTCDHPPTHTLAREFFLVTVTLGMPLWCSGLDLCKAACDNTIWIIHNANNLHSVEYNNVFICMYILWQHNIAVLAYLVLF